MYVRCKLRLSQDNNSLDVILDRVTGAALRDGFSFWGRFSSSEGNIPPERKLWLYALGRLELTLMDGGGEGVGMVGGGLKFGEMASLSPSATLSHALMSSRGYMPSDSSGIGVGEVLNGFEISVRFHPGRMTWQLQGVQKEGSNVWYSP